MSKDQPKLSTHERGEAFQDHVHEILAKHQNVNAYEVLPQERLALVDGAKVKPDFILEVKVADQPWKVLVECKGHKSPIKAEVMSGISDKVRSSDAVLGILVHDSSLQRTGRTRVASNPHLFACSVQELESGLIRGKFLSRVSAAIQALLSAGTDTSLLSHVASAIGWKERVEVIQEERSLLIPRRGFPLRDQLGQVRANILAGPGSSPGVAMQVGERARLLLADLDSLPQQKVNYAFGQLKILETVLNYSPDTPARLPAFRHGILRGARALLPLIDQERFCRNAMNILRSEVPSSSKDGIAWLLRTMDPDLLLSLAEPEDLIRLACKGHSSPSECATIQHSIMYALACAGSKLGRDFFNDLAGSPIKQQYLRDYNLAIAGSQPNLLINSLRRKEQAPSKHEQWSSSWQRTVRLFFEKDVQTELDNR